MAHWSDAYMGREYLPGVADCAALAQAVAREVLGLAVALPAEHATQPFARNVQIRTHRDSVAERVQEPIEGHPVLMLARGRLQHIGVMCDMGGRWYVLHADDGFGEVIRQPLRLRGDVHFVDECVIEGFYKWK